MNKHLPYLLFLTLLLTSCYGNWNTDPTSGISFDGTGYRPVYSPAEQVFKVDIGPGRQLSDPGKIYTFDPYIFINERGKGIHIVDNTDPRSPKNLSFISIASNYDIAVKDKWLYADNHSSLLVFDISNPAQPKLTKRVENAIPGHNYPSQQNVYFECPDPSKGVITGWEKVAMNQQPKCFR